MHCPKCASTNYRTNGKTKKGTVRYFCKDCRKSWSDRPIGRPTKGLVAMTNAERQRRHREKVRNQQDVVTLSFPISNFVIRDGYSMYESLFASS